jgi:hypothetical protein
MKIAADICIYTNASISVEELSAEAAGAAKKSGD